MKKWLISCLGLLVVIGIYYLIPKPVNQTLKGIEYQLGENHREINPVTIKVNGREYHTLLGKRVFKGKIKIVGSEDTNPDQSHQLEIPFSWNTGGIIGYGYFKNKKPYTAVYGGIYASSRFKQITITEYRNDGNGRGWTSGNGWMITAPANSRSKALEISNELMKKDLHGKLK